MNTEKKLHPFVRAMRVCFLEKYIAFKGRASRSEFWWWCLACYGICLIPYLGWVLSLALVVPSLAVGARRLQDIGESPYYLFLLCIPVVGTILLIIMWARPGEEDNQYGPKPLD